MKQVIAVRTDVEMSAGKKMVQACHASLGAYRNADGSVAERWVANGAKKAVVKVDSEEELEQRFRKARSTGLPAYLVKDAGETELEPGTVTALGVGPGNDGDVDDVTGNLKLV